MNAIADFTALMGEIRAHQQELSSLYQKISRPEEKEMLGKLMSEIENARQQAEEIVPATLQQIKGSAVRTKQQAQQHLSELAKQRQQTQQAAEKEAGAIKAVPAAAPAAEVRVDPSLGPTLREELLKRFVQQPDVQSTTTIREAWEDWQ